MMAAFVSLLSLVLVACVILIGVPVSLTQPAADVVSIGNSIAGEFYALICSVTLVETSGIPTIEWTGPGVNREGVTTIRIPSTALVSHLTFNPLQQSDAGQYRCRATLNSLNDDASVNIVVGVPSVTVMTFTDGTETVGESYVIICTVAGSETLDAQINTNWLFPGGNGDQSEGVTLAHQFTALQLSDAGQYICSTSIDSPYLENTLTLDTTLNINLMVPSPEVVITHDGGSVQYAGSSLTLTCTVTLTDDVMASEVTVRITWIVTGGAPLDTFAGRINSGTPTEQLPGDGLTGVMYRSSYILNTLRTFDTANYECKTTVSHMSTFVANGGSSTSVEVTVQSPTLALSLTASTRCLPNVAPHNTFSITCSATAPDGVISPKSFSWSRRVDPDGLQTTGLSTVSSNIMNSDVTKPVSTSVVTVTETTIGLWRYRCQADLDELSIEETGDIYSINVTGPADPEHPSNLRSIGTGSNSAIIQWTVPMIAFTPETYVVHYGTSRESLDLLSEPVESGSIFDMENKMFDVQLTPIIHGVTYYYQVEATNTKSSSLSLMQSFIITEASVRPAFQICWKPLSDASVQVSWTEPDGSTDLIVGYRITLTEYGRESELQMKDVNSSTFTTLFDNGLEAGVPYTALVTALNSAGDEEQAVVTNFTRELVPSSPKNVTATRLGETHVQITWSTLSLTEARGFVKFYRISLGDDYVQMTSATESSVLFSDLKSDESYTAHVAAVNGAGQGMSTEVGVPVAESSGTSTYIVIILGVAAGILFVIIMAFIAALRYQFSRFKKYHTGNDQTEAESDDPYITTTKCAAYTAQQPCVAYGTLQQSSAQPPAAAGIPTTACVTYGTLQQSSVQQPTTAAAGIPTTACVAYGTLQQSSAQPPAAAGIPTTACVAYGTLQQSSAQPPAAAGIPTTACVAYGTLQQSSVRQPTADIPTSPCVAYGNIQPATSTL